MLRWYVLYTKPHAERQVTRHLQGRGHIVYYPSIPVAHPRRGRPVRRAYFPCYVFVNYDLEASGLSNIIYTPGLRGLVEFGGEPATVTETDIQKIRAEVAKPQVWDDQGLRLERGDEVELLTEPFREVEAVFDRRLTDGARVRVFLHYLEVHALERKQVEHQVALELDADLVRKRRT